MSVDLVYLCQNLGLKPKNAERLINAAGKYLNPEEPPKAPKDIKITSKYSMKETANRED